MLFFDFFQHPTKNDTVDLDRSKNFEIFDSVLSYRQIHVLDTNNETVDSLMTFVGYRERYGFKIFQFYYPLKPVNPRKFESDDSNFNIEYRGITELDSIIQKMPAFR